MGSRLTTIDVRRPAHRPHTLSPGCICHPYCSQSRSPSRTAILPPPSQALHAVKSPPTWHVTPGISPTHSPSPPLCRSRS